MTEEEAKTKWCPFARILLSLVHRDAPASMNVSFNRLTREDADATAFPFPGVTCIGSACMAWRQSSVGMQYEPIGREKPHGFCGLAGKP